MKYEWIDEYLLDKKRVQKDYKLEWEAYRFMVENKMFVMLAQDKQKKDIITVKVEPLYGEVLRKEYKDIVPGYYMNKQHWVSINREGQVPDSVVKEILDKSYLTLLASFSKKIQKEILEETKEEK